MINTSSDWFGAIVSCLIILLVIGITFSLIQPKVNEFYDLYRDSCSKCNSFFPSSTEQSYTSRIIGKTTANPSKSLLEYRFICGDKILAIVTEQENMTSQDKFNLPIYSINNSVSCEVSKQ